MAQKFTSIAENILFTTLRIVTRVQDGSSGVGTAFLYSIEKGDQSAIFVVTNKHVVAGALTGDILFTQRASDGQPDLQNKYALHVTDFEAMWRGHPDPSVDVTIAAFVPLLNHLKSQGIDPYYKTVGEGLAPNAQMLEELDALEECVFVGYPSDIWDSTHNLPVTRRGMTATHPAVDFRGTPTFLLDASVFPGSSGSPVLIYNRGAVPTSKMGATTIGTRVVFLGLLASVFFREQEGRLEQRPVPTAQADVPVTTEMLDLGVVFKARTIRETIDEHFPNLFGADEGAS